MAVHECADLGTRCGCPAGDVAEFLVSGVEAGLGVDEPVEAEDPLHRVVHLRRLAVDDRPELSVREERPVRLDRLGPAQVDAGDRAGLGVAQVASRGPAAADRRGARAAVDDEVDVDPCGDVGGVEVPPALPPHLGAAGPALGVAGERDLGGLGEARLPRAVATGDDREARARLERELRRGADAAERCDPDARDVGADRLGGCGVSGEGSTRLRAVRRLPAQGVRQGRVPVERGQDEVLDVSGQVGVGQPRDDVCFEVAVRVR